MRPCHILPVFMKRKRVLTLRAWTIIRNQMKREKRSEAEWGNRTHDLRVLDQLPYQLDYKS